MRKLDNRGESSLPAVLTLIFMVTLIVGMVWYVRTYNLQETVKGIIEIILAVMAVLGLFFTTIAAVRTLEEHKEQERRAHRKKEK